MMKLSQASSYFDRTEVQDAFSLTVLFNGQVEPFEDSRRDAASAYRRILSVAPGVQMPSHRCVRLLGQNWILGQSEVDGLAELHRQKYVIAQARSLLKVSSLAQYLAGAHSGTVYAAPFWNKDAKQIETSSELPQLFDVFLPTPVPAQSILWNDTEAYLVSSARPLASGLLSAFSLKLDNPVETGTVTSRTYSHTAGEYTTFSSPDLQVLRVRWQSLFEYDSQTEQKRRPGDLAIVVPMTEPVDTSSLLTVAGVSYQVLSVDLVGGAQVAHARRT